MKRAISIHTKVIHVTKPRASLQLSCNRSLHPEQKSKTKSHHSSQFVVHTTAVGVAHFALPLLDAHNHRPHGNVDQEVECGTTHGSFLFYRTSFPFFFSSGKTNNLWQKSTNCWTVLQPDVCITGYCSSVKRSDYRLIKAKTQ